MSKVISTKTGVFVSTDSRSGGAVNQVRLLRRRSGRYAIQVLVYGTTCPPGTYLDTSTGECVTCPTQRTLVCSWSVAFSSNDADALVWYLAAALGYEPGGMEAPDSALLYAARDQSGRLGIRICAVTLGRGQSVFVSREAAQRLLEALAKDLDWKLTG